MCCDFVYLGVSSHVTDKDGKLKEKFEIPGLRSWDGFNQANFADSSTPGTNEGPDPIAKLNDSLKTSAVSTRIIPVLCINMVPPDHRPMIKNGKCEFHESFSTPLCNA